MSTQSVIDHIRATTPKSTRNRRRSTYRPPANKLPGERTSDLVAAIAFLAGAWIAAGIVYYISQK